MSAILELPEVRARMRRWTVAEYIALAEDNPAFRGFELIRGIIVRKMSNSQYCIVLAERREIEGYLRPENGVYREKRTYHHGETIPCACVEGGAVPVETWFS